MIHGCTGVQYFRNMKMPTERYKKVYLCFNECSSPPYEDILLTVPIIDIILFFEEITSFLRNYSGYLKKQNYPMTQHYVEHIKKLDSSL